MKNQREFTIYQVNDLGGLLFYPFMVLKTGFPTGIVSVTVDEQPSLLRILSVKEMCKAAAVITRNYPHNFVKSVISAMDIQMSHYMPYGKPCDRDVIIHCSMIIGGMAQKELKSVKNGQNIRHFVNGH